MTNDKGSGGDKRSCPIGGGDLIKHSMPPARKAIPINELQLWVEVTGTFGPSNAAHFAKGTGDPCRGGVERDESVG